jgi:hypothetical protein
MNPGTFTGLSVGAAGQSITRYTQTPIILSSRTVAVPEGVKRIEALLCGGGGGGGLANNGGGGGFGGLAIIEVPVTGSPLQVVIGAGGAAGTSTQPTSGGDGSPTYVISAGTRYAEVGGGGGGAGYIYNYGTPGWPGNGRSGGGGGGASNGNGYYSNGGDGGPAPIGNILWTWAPNTLRKLAGSTSGGYRYHYQIPEFASSISGAARYVQTTAGAGTPNSTTLGMGGDGALGGGGGGAYVNPGCGGGNGNPSIPGGAGALGNSGTAGGSMASVTIWGITGKAGGASYDSNGGGGGGMLSAGTTYNWWAGGGSGGLGGGGGAGAITEPGSGGAGFAVIRFYF